MLLGAINMQINVKIQTYYPSCVLIVKQLAIYAMISGKLFVANIRELLLQPMDIAMTIPMIVPNTLISVRIQLIVLKCVNTVSGLAIYVGHVLLKAANFLS
uniref:Uncharacterized protein n=1 Tax=Acrobeloides nanus TaxID=290746 RepID=A0A914EDP8_9BILA